MTMKVPHGVYIYINTSSLFAETKFWFNFSNNVMKPIQYGVGENSSLI